jgi:monomeric isocitrate dehydrogenase
MSRCSNGSPNSWWSRTVCKVDRELAACPTVEYEVLKFNRSSARGRGEPDNRGRHFLAANEAKINAELIAAQGKPVDTGGYYLPDPAKASAAMRPSSTLNAALAAL